MTKEFLFRVGTDNVLDDNDVTASKIAALAVTTAKIDALAVTEAKIGALAVTEGKIGAEAVTAGKIGALAVTSAKIGADAVTEDKVDLAGTGGNFVFTAEVLRVAGLPSAFTTAEAVINKGYADAVASGLDLKASVRVATAAALPASTFAAGPQTLTANAVGILTVDGVPTVLNDRILVKDQAAGLENGIYKVTTEGTAGVAFVLTRATDADSDAEVTAGMFTFVEEGTANDNQGWVLITNNPIDLNTDALVFSQFSSSALNYATTAEIADVNNGAESAGTSGTVARGDHRHKVTAAAPVTIGTANAIGSGDDLALATHVHNHGSQTTGTHHAEATSSVNGFVSAADWLKLQDQIRATVTTTLTAASTTLATIPTASDEALAVEVLVTASDPVLEITAFYKLIAYFFNNSGVIAQKGPTIVVSFYEDGGASTWDADFTFPGQDILLRVNADALSTVVWKVNGIVTRSP